jgi:hypothetical protein
MGTLRQFHHDLFVQDARPRERRSWVATTRCTLTARPRSRTTPAKVKVTRDGLATPIDKGARARYHLCRATYPREAPDRALDSSRWISAPSRQLITSPRSLLQAYRVDARGPIARPPDPAAMPNGRCHKMEVRPPGHAREVSAIALGIPYRVSSGVNTQRNEVGNFQPPLSGIFNRRRQQCGQPAGPGAASSPVGCRLRGRWRMGDTLPLGTKCQAATFDRGTNRGGHGRGALRRQELKDAGH